MIRVRTRPRNRDEFALRTIEAAGRRAELEASRMVIEIRQELRKLLDQDFDRRSGDRRKRGTVHLHNSFRVTVERGPKPGGFPYNVVISLLPNLTDDEKAKVLSLINGSRPHDIDPKTKSALSWTSPSGGTVVVKRVGAPVTRQHPGTKGTDTVRRARNNVVARRRRQR